MRGGAGGRKGGRQGISLWSYSGHSVDDVLCAVAVEALPRYGSRNILCAKRSEEVVAVLISLKVCCSTVYSIKTKNEMK